MRCPHCDSKQVVHEASTVCCQECGFVIDDHNIVVDEDARGESSVVGQFVPSLPRRNRYGVVYSRESREVTIEGGRRRIAQLAALLSLRPHHIEAAQRLFMLAVQHNFIQGRKTQNVVAACLYIVCRREKTPHMLVDFADVLQTSVYTLGHTYLRFCRLLNLQIPIIDPSLYIQRFAAQLEFEDQTIAVANTALRLVQRMGRDWIQTGRRPAGICGAGLLLAARLHSFKRTQQEVVQVVRVCDVTLRKRLFEFYKTPSSALTYSEFENADFTEECDPPAFSQARIKEEKKIQMIEGPVKLAKKSGSELPHCKEEKKSARSVKLEETGHALKREKLADEGGNESPESNASQPIPVEEVEREIAAVLQGEEFKQVQAKLELQVKEIPLSSKNAEESAVVPRQSFRLEGEDDLWSGGTADVDIDNEELDHYIHSATEVQAKERIWNAMNKEYLEELEAKQQEEAERVSSKPKRRRRRERERRDGPADSAAEATMEVLKRRVTSKVNWTALDRLFSVDPDTLDGPSITASESTSVMNKM